MSATVQYPATTARGQGRLSRSTPWSATAYVLLIQGLYYFLTGIWPLFSIDTFQMVTGPKTDLWLVQTVGVLIGVIGLVLLAAMWRGWATVEVVLLATGSALALAGVDLVFVAQQIISRICLLDAAAEGVLLLAWIAALVYEARTNWQRSATCL
jgi:hypothetical protein